MARVAGRINRDLEGFLAMKAVGRWLRALGGAGALAVLLAGSTAHGQEAVEQARAFFRAGAKLYDAGKFAEAVQSFEEAYRLSPRSSLLFSIAQAERRQYFVTKRVETLRSAIAHYRKYLDEVPQGGRRADAAQGLAELEMLAPKVDPVPSAAASGSGASGAPPSAPSAPPAPSRPRLSIMSTQVAGAQIVVDGRDAVEGIFSDEVDPGKHTVKVSAPGYHDEVREVVLQRTPVALDVTLRERPARVSFEAPAGAQISVDGRLVGQTPLPLPLEIAAGAHMITVTRNGYESVTLEVELERGEERSLAAPLSVTKQRVASIALLGTAAASAVTGGVFVALALSKQAEAQRIEADRQKGNITQAQLDAYRGAVEQRDGMFRPGAAVAFGVGAGLGLVGAMLYAFDQPAPGAGAARREHPRGEPAPKPAAPMLDMSIAPGSFGAALRGVF